MAIKHLHVLKADVKKGTGAKSGAPYSFTALQGTMHFEDGTVEVFVLDMWPKRGEEAKPVTPGFYVPTLELKANAMTRKLEGTITDLRPVVVK